MPGRRPLLVLSTVAFSAFVLAAVPADPTITAAPLLPRQNDAGFIGWIESSSGVWASDTCDAGNTWYQDAKYAQCCPISLASCYAPTACVSGSLIYPYSDRSTTRTIACTDNYQNKAASICNTVFIFENMSDSSPKTDIVCGSASQNWSYYRKIPASLTEAKASASNRAVSSALAGGNVAQNAGKGKSSSKAWIAGAVIGPVLGLLLVGALVWFCLRRRKNKNKLTAPQQGGALMASVDPSHPPAGVGGYTDAKPQFAPQQQAAFTPDPYANQAAFVAQQNYADVPVSPIPQYNAGVAPYNTSVPYNGAGSPPPQQTFYGNDAKQAYTGVPLGGASELGNAETSGVGPTAHNVSAHQAAELGGDSRQGGAGTFGTSELPTTAPNHKPVV